MQTQLGNAEEIETDKREITSMDKIKPKVKYILEKYPETKGDDILLVWRYYREFYSDKIRFSFRQFRNLLELPAMESITRNRRFIQKPMSDGGELRPTKRTQRKRLRRENLLRQYSRK